MKVWKWLYIIREDDATSDIEHFGIMDKRYAGNPKWYVTLPLIDAVRKWLWSFTVDLIIGDGTNNRFALRTDGSFEARRVGKQTDINASTGATNIPVGDAEMIYDVNVTSSTTLTATGVALKGAKLTLLLKNNGTGYTITFGGGFNVNQLVQTANKVSVIELRFNGTNFIEVVRNTEP
jgi:hypothetical protein